MKYDSPDLKLLGLTDVEHRIFSVLSFEQSLSVTSSSELAEVPRTSALPALKRLSTRGLVRKVSSGSKTLWKKTNSEKLRRSIANMLFALEIEEQFEELEKEVAIKISTQSEFILIKGAKNILRFQENSIKEHTKERSILAQGSKTSMTVAKLDLMSEFSRLNTLIKEQGIVTELLVSDKTLEEYEALMKKDNDWKESMRERLVVLYIVNSDMLADSAIDITMYKNRVSIINWEEQTMVVIKNKETMNIFRNWFGICIEQSQKINPNQFFA